ncbi:MAG TPA: nicotinate-nicotinamide nucleotide adenylyltransferase, partial [Blastocatellia bacterium]|nr:nicotinate-nicotinamide nucleotide adenylyltransferase [Blastocatellia bacterium]
MESSQTPQIRIIKPAEKPAQSLGVFASSFNPVTNAHLKLIQTARSQFELDAVLALAGTSNADKTHYEASLTDRIEMLSLALESWPEASIGLTSTGFFVDMIGALQSVYPPNTLYSFIVGFDTFIRILDPDNRYVSRYDRKFRDSLEALGYLLERSRLIVVERGPHGESGFSQIVAEHGLRRNASSPSMAFADRIAFMSFARDFSERSATEVRENVESGRSIEGLVPRSVADY